MDPMYVEFAKYGPVALICGVLLWQAIKTNDRLGKRLDANNDALVDLVQRNTEAFLCLRDTLDRRPCLQGDKALKSARDTDTHAPV
jgi:hypothetical protein